MKPADDQASASSPPAQEVLFDLVCGSGGSKAILASAGAILACHFAGIKRFRRIGGASGGSIATALLASGMHPTKLVRLAMETDFTDLITRHASLWQVIVTYFLKDNFYLLVRPRKGLFSSYRLGKFIDEHVPAWPDNFWTVAVSGSCQFVFTKDGVYEYRVDGTHRRVSKQPAPVGLAVRASSAIPGVFDAIKYRGHYLFDGALSVDGRTPVGPLHRHHGNAAPERIIAVDVGDDSTERPMMMFLLWKVFWRLVCGKHCPIEGETPVNSRGTILVQPEITEFESLQFKLDAAKKWAGVMTGFKAACDSLAKAGVLKGSKLEEARSIIAGYEKIRSSSYQPDERAARTQALLTAHGLYQ